MTRARHIAWMWAVVFLMLPPLAAFAGEVNLPKTGQTTCYDASGNVIACPGTGQDGDVQAGVEWPSPRFTDNGNGTVTDNLTGLIWLKNANCPGGTRNWTSAVSYCNTLASGSCGLTDGSVAGDWRLPNIVELESLVYAEVSNPALANTAGTGKWSQGDPFTNVQSSSYWSSSTFAGYASYAWIVGMGFGHVGGDGKYYNDVMYVWPVRGGQ